MFLTELPSISVVLSTMCLWGEAEYEKHLRGWKLTVMNALTDDKDWEVIVYFKKITNNTWNIVKCML